MAEMLRMSQTLCAQQQERVAVLTTQVLDLETASSAADESTVTLEAGAFKELITAHHCEGPVLIESGGRVLSSGVRGTVYAD